MSALRPALAIVGTGLRLARAGGRLRASLVVAGTAVGVLLLLVLVGVTAGLRPEGGMTVEEGRLTAVVAVAVAVPVAVLIATVVRLSAATRDRRLAALRLLGLSPARTQAATAVEAGALAAVGAVAGAVAFVAARPGLLRVPLPRGVALPDLPLHPAPALAVLAGVPLLAVAVSLAPAMDLRARAAAVRRERGAHGGPLRSGWCPWVSVPRPWSWLC